MGSEDGGSDEKPVHTVTVKSFYMSKYEVTQKEWREVMGTDPSKFKGDNLPVEQVSWYEAIDYCNRRSQKEGLTPAYFGNSLEDISCNWKANGYRLPTEAEWEYAAKGKDMQPQQAANVFSLSAVQSTSKSSLGDVAWYGGNSGSTTHPVGTKLPNGFGLYDMLGNVWEWCWDWYGSDGTSAGTDPTGPGAGTYRVARGGGWNNSAGDVRAAYRFANTPSARDIPFGFRVVRGAP
jgi:formylglycine-generating enzyme required for sulfatase activity